jgi:hypothetical protein
MRNTANQNEIASDGERPGTMCIASYRDAHYLRRLCLLTEMELIVENKIPFLIILSCTGSYCYHYSKLYVYYTLPLFSIL